jgi:RNA polymerase sigma-70 factor (family 1)
LIPPVAPPPGLPRSPSGGGFFISYFLYFYSSTSTAAANLLTEDPNNERELLLLISEGDERAFYQFYEKYTDIIHPFLKKYSTSDAEIKDILQETFIKVWLHRDKLHEVQNIKGWLYKMAARTFLNHLAKEKNARQRIRHLTQTSQGEYTLHNVVYTKEIELAIRQAVDNLSEQKRKIFSLNRDQDLKPGEIAARLDMPLSTVKNQLSAALKEIRQHLINSGLGPLTVACILLTF